MRKFLLGLATIAIATTAPLGASVVAHQPSSYDQCVIERSWTCYPNGPGGPFIPFPGSPEEAEFNQCVAWIEQGCRAQFPDG